MIAVFGDAANETFHSNFHLKFEEDEALVREHITLLMVKTHADGNVYMKIIHP